MAPPTEQEAKSGKTVETAGQRSEHRNHGVPGDGQSKAAPGADAVHQPPAKRQANGIGHAERDHQVGVIGVAPVILDLQVGREQRKRLPVNVINDEHGADPPAQMLDRAWPRTGGLFRGGHLSLFCGSHFFAQQAGGGVIQVHGGIGMLAQDGGR